MDMLPKTAVNLMEQLSQDYVVSSWRIQGITNLTLSFKLTSTADDIGATLPGYSMHSEVGDRYYRSKPPSSRNRDMARQTRWLGRKYTDKYSGYGDQTETFDSGAASAFTISSDISNIESAKVYQQSHICSSTPSSGTYSGNKLHSNDRPIQYNQSCSNGASDHGSLQNQSDSPMHVTFNKQTMVDSAVSTEHYVSNVSSQTSVPLQNSETQTGNIIPSSAETQTDKNTYQQLDGQDMQHKNKRTQTQRQPYGTAYIQTMNKTDSCDTQTPTTQFSSVSCSTEAPLVKDQSILTETCVTISRHVETFVNCKSRGTQYKCQTKQIKTADDVSHPACLPVQPSVDNVSPSTSPPVQPSVDNVSPTTSPPVQPTKDDMSKRKLASVISEGQR